MSKMNNPWRIHTKMTIFLVNELGQKQIVNIEDAGCTINDGHEWHTEAKEEKYLVADTPEGLKFFIPGKDGKMTENQREAWENGWTDCE